jgi:hypothetical protein
MDSEPESALVSELLAVAEPSAAGASEFSITRGGLRIGVSYSCGSSSSLTLKANYDEVARPLPPSHGYRATASGVLPAPRPLRILLRPEHADDVAAKREGISVEWQSGDAEFDDRAYVETDVVDPAVLAAVLNERVRAASLVLIDAGFRQLCIDDDGRITATIVEFVQPVPRPRRGERAIDAFAQLLGNMPALSHVDVPRAPIPLIAWTWLLGAIGVLGWALNVGWFGIVVTGFHAITGTSPKDPAGSAIAASIGSGIAAGVVAWKIYGDIVRERVRGRSDAHKLILKARLAAFGGVSVLVFSAAVIAALAAAEH